MQRLTLSQEDGAARDHLVRWMRDKGFRVTIDAMGNVFGLLDLAGPDAPVVMTGSHLDSQPNGGRFDGAYGVLAACEAVEAVRARLRTRARRFAILHTSMVASIASRSMIETRQGIATRSATRAA